MPTSAPLDPAIQVISEGNVTRYILPPRQLDDPRVGAAVLIAFGLVTATFSVVWIITAAGLFQQGARPPGFFMAARWAFAAFGLPGLVFSCIPTVIGVGLLFPNHSEISVDENYLYDREIAGPIRLSFKRRLKDLRVLHVAFQKRDGQDAPANPTAGARYCCIFAEGNFKKRMVVAAAYPRDLLIPLAQAISGRYALASPSEVLQVEEAEPAEIKVEIDAPPQPAASLSSPGVIPDQPVQSRILVAQTAGVTSVLVPRQWLRSSMVRFLLGFSTIWCSVVFFILGVAIFGTQQAKNRFAAQIDLHFVLIAGLFSIVGVGLFFYALSLMVRKAAFVATADALTLSQKGLFKEKERQWPCAQIMAITCGDSGTRVNERPLKQLQIQLAGGKVVGLLTGRDTDELTWLAAVLNDKCAGAPAARMPE